MGLNFRRFANDGDAAEITVRAVDCVSPSGPNCGAVAAWSPGTLTLDFGRYKDVAQTTAFQWYTDANQAGTGAFGANIDDFLTVALHEVGHIVGLEHQNDTDDIICTLAGRFDQINTNGGSSGSSRATISRARGLSTRFPSRPVPCCWGSSCCCCGGGRGTS